MAKDKLNNLVEIVEQTASERGLFDAQTPLLLMVSGGCDSTSLCYIARELRERGEISEIAALHVNHKLRGQDAEDDQKFVECLCHELDIPLYTVEVDVAKIAESAGENIEACGRRERYTSAAEALNSLCTHYGKDFSEGRIVTAHTLNDRVENFYMRSIVGTGPGGFRSMKYKNANVIRPLLDITRDELVEMMQKLQLAGQATEDACGNIWREDATNAHTDQFRAFVRQEIVPVAKARNEKLHQTLLRTMNLIADEDDMLDELASQLLNEYCEFDGTSAKLAPAFSKEKVPLQKRAIFKLLDAMKPGDERVENASVEAILNSFSDNKTKNIQFNLAVSSNKTGVLIEPMGQYRSRRKKE